VLSDSKHWNRLQKCRDFGFRTELMHARPLETETVGHQEASGLEYWAQNRHCSGEQVLQGEMNFHTLLTRAPERPVFGKYDMATVLTNLPTIV
jgi:hypothetical protein